MDVSVHFGGVFRLKNYGSRWSGLKDPLRFVFCCLEISVCVCAYVCMCVCVCDPRATMLRAGPWIYLWRIATECLNVFPNLYLRLLVPACSALLCLGSLGVCSEWYAKCLWINLWLPTTAHESAPCKHSQKTSRKLVFWDLYSYVYIQKRTANVQGRVKENQVRA